MKRIAGVLAGLLISFGLMSQTPDAFNYQAVARDATGSPLTNVNISVRISILPGSESSSAIYSESFSLTTNSFGLFNLEVGNGSVIFGDFPTIDWADGPYFLKSELVLDGESSSILVGTGKLLSVPYALRAKFADNMFSGSYNDLMDAPNWADSINQSEFSGDYNDLANLPGWNDSIAKYNFSGDYNDLANLPGWNDSIAKYSFSGFYNDLIDLPNWSDSIAQYTDGAVVPEGVVDAGNMLIYDGTYWVAKDLVMANTGLSQAVDIMSPFTVLNFCIALVGVYPSRDIADPFIGTIGVFGFNFAPRGWAKCDGQLMPIILNQSLFSLLGTMYGGDGRTTFGLPDLRGRTAIHHGDGSGLSSRNQGFKGGAETVILTVGALPAHSHVITFE